jgi:hypothetical protein
LIDNITHAFEDFKNLDTIIEGLGFQLVPLAEPIDTIGEKLIDLDASILNM